MPTLVTTANKTAAQALLPLTQQASGVVTLGSAFDVSTNFGARVFVKMGRIAATALTNNVGFRLEASAKASGNDEWFPLIKWTCTLGTTAASSTTLNGATTAGNLTSTLTSVTGFGAGNQVYCRETGTPANSEWSRVASISGSVLTFEEVQTRSHANSIAVTNLSESWTFELDTSGISRIRLIVDSASSNTEAAAASGQTVDVIGWLTTFDSTATV